MTGSTHRLWKKIAGVFPDATLAADHADFGANRLRFELGGRHANGSARRINQAVSRACAIFGDLFRNSKSLILVVYDWDISGIEMNPSEPTGHLFTLVKDHVLKRSMIDRSARIGRAPWRRLFMEVDVRAIDVHGLMRAIGNNEQGRSPHINQKVYFADTETATAFHMYDDRGCFVWMMDFKEIRHVRRSRWIVE